VSEVKGVLAEKKTPDATGNLIKKLPLIKQGKRKDARNVKA